MGGLIKPRYNKLSFLKVCVQYQHGKLIFG